jgi:hypothetical protein
MDKKEPEKMFDTVKKMFTDLKSKYGGKPEGVVLKDDEGKIYKILSTDQHDAETRMNKKLTYRMDKDKETEYFKELRTLATKILDEMKIGDKAMNDAEFDKILSRLSERIYSMEVNVKHDKKNNMKKQDDLYLTAKNLLGNNFEGNRWALFLGKIRVLTNAHEYIIRKALEKYDGVIIATVTTEDSEIPKQLKELVLKDAFKDEIRKGKVELIEASTGNIVALLKKTDKNIVAVLAGGDRMEAYEKQINHNLNIKLDATARDSEESALKGGGEFSKVSATKAIEAIKADNEQLFRKMVPQSTWKYYDKYKKILDNQPEEMIQGI